MPKPKTASKSKTPAPPATQSAPATPGEALARAGEAARDLFMANGDHLDWSSEAAAMRHGAAEAMLLASAHLAPGSLADLARGEGFHAVDRAVDRLMSAAGKSGQLIKNAIFFPPPMQPSAEALTASQAVADAAKSALQALLDAGIPREHPGYSMLPLNKACILCSWAVPMLLAAGCDPLAADRHGEPLTTAVSFRADIVAVKALLDAGCDPRRKFEGRSALDIANDLGAMDEDIHALLKAAAQGGSAPAKAKPKSKSKSK